jgi:hypothetical protein
MADAMRDGKSIRAVAKQSLPAGEVVFLRGAGCRS